MKFIPAVAYIYVLGAMFMKHLQLLFLFIVTLTLWTHPAKGQTSVLINPTGVYKYSGKTYTKNGDTYGYFGTIKVSQLDQNKVLVNFYVCKGAPSYNSGSFIDTLTYINNQSVYRGDTTMIEGTCKLNFKFTSKGIYAELFSDYPNTACGFGHAVDAQGYYKKRKGKIPTKEEMLEGEQ
jgi:hypothetical protein